MAHRVVVNTELLRNGADCPVFGVEQVTNVSLRFKIEHPIPPFQEYGSMNRPRRPQTMQRSQPENARGLLWRRAGVGVVACSRILQRSEERRVGKECRSRWGQTE